MLYAEHAIEEMLVSSGKYYIDYKTLRGRSSIAGPFDTEDEAEDGARILTASGHDVLSIFWAGRQAAIESGYPLERHASEALNSSEAMPALARPGSYGLPQLYHLKLRDSDIYFLAFEPTTSSRLNDFKGLRVDWYHGKRKPNKAIQGYVKIARPGEIGFHEIRIEDVPQSVIDRFEERFENA